MKRLTALLLCCLMVGSFALQSAAAPLGDLFSAQAQVEQKQPEQSDSDTTPSTPAIDSDYATGAQKLDVSQGTVPFIDESDPLMQNLAVYMVELTTDTLIHSRNADVQKYPASLTKIMTAIVALDSGVPLDEVVMDYITSELKGVVSKAQYGETDNRIHTISYNDVKAGDWYANAVNYVTLTGLMNGTGDGFSPNLAINRGMMVTVLYRMAGSPEVTAENPFTDVPADTWYTDAVIWASENDITAGTSDTTFSPTNSLTREQLATFFYRFADFENPDPIEITGDLTGFTDAGQVASYATDAMKWAIGEGLISGTTETTLSPKATATRAQVATILMRYTAE